MSLNKVERITYVGCPWFFSMVLLVCGIIVSYFASASLQGTILLCAGLICMSLYCVCALLSKLLNN